MSDVFLRTQILANCAILYPPPALPTLITVRDNEAPRILVVDSKTGQLFLEHSGTSLAAFLALCIHTETLLDGHLPTLCRGQLPEVEEHILSSTEEDSNAIQRLKAENARLLSENDELRQRLDQSTSLHAEALKMVQTSCAHQMQALVMAQRYLERQLGETDNSLPPSS
jgi:regulator of replication initiation timing